MINKFERTELIKCANPTTGPAYFLQNYFYIQHPTRGSIQFQPYDYQNELIDSYVNNKFSINLISRQLGKTATSAGYLLWTALFENDSNILVGGNKLATAREILQRILYAYDYVPDFLKADITVRNKMAIEFENGSRIITQAVNMNMARGMAVSLLYLDEFSYVRNSDAIGVWQSIEPAFSATKTRVIINSTANLETDYFADLWRGACLTENNFVPFAVDWRRHPDRDQAWADQQASIIGADQFATEYENRFALSE